jgi:predicted dinucleotide-binding enzyme
VKIGILGSGVVAQTLGAGFARHGHDVMLGTRNPTQLADWASQQRGVRIGSLPDTSTFADVAVLAVKGTAALDVLRAADASRTLAGKVLIDAVNPIADGAPEHGVLRFFTTLDDSLMEREQREFPSVRFVKAFNSVGSALMIDPQLPGGRPTMFICGNDDAAKQSVIALLAEVGWDSADMGRVEAARAIEPLAMLWCIPGFLRNDWVHAFKLVSPG